jgi:hypothetical protein
MMCAKGPATVSDRVFARGRQIGSFGRPTLRARPTALLV